MSFFFNNKKIVVKIYNWVKKLLIKDEKVSYYCISTIKYIIFYLHNDIMEIDPSGPDISVSQKCH